MHARCALLVFSLMPIRHLPILLLGLGLAACDAPAPPVAPPPPVEPQAAPAPPAPPAKPPAANAARRETLRPPQRPAPSAAPAVEEPVLLDLSLPEGPFDNLGQGSALAAPAPLLPPLLDRPPPSRYQVGGRLIESLDQERLFDGAELRLEMRR